MSNLRKFVFLNFPVLARDEIYAYLLIKSYDPNKIVPRDYSYERVKRVLHPPILATNHQIHEEAARVLYGKNVHFWTLDRMMDGPTYLYKTKRYTAWRALPQHYFNLVRYVRLDIDCSFIGFGAYTEWHDYMERTAADNMLESVEYTVKGLKQTELKELVVAFYNCRDGQGSDPVKPLEWYDEPFRCPDLDEGACFLEPLGEIRGLAKVMTLPREEGYDSEEWEDKEGHNDDNYDEDGYGEGGHGEGYWKCYGEGYGEDCGEHYGDEGNGEMVQEEKL
jgi:hypothetical protein